MTRVYIITTCFNAVNFIEETIKSVVSQSTKTKIIYHVQDAGSSDGTVAILDRWWVSAKRGELPDNVDFTYASEHDSGMYQGIERGFDRFDIDETHWMTWINAGDHLFPDAVETISKISIFPEVSWVVGRKSVFNSQPGEKTLPQTVLTDLIAAGYYSGDSGPFIQQEGVFWRHELWKKRPKRFGSFKLAGDFHLWRAFAQADNAWCIDKNLGAFRIHSDQKSVVMKNEYMEECALGDFLQTPLKIDQALKIPPKLRKIKQSKDDQLVLETAYDHAATRQVENSVFPMRACRVGSLITLDANWQYPAITELHALRSIRASASDCSKVVYLAYPWATLIDVLQTGQKSKADYLMRALRECADLVEEGEYVVTVCQHILMLQYLYLFDFPSVDEVFWSHARKDLNIPGYIISSFPLFPVQRAEDIVAEKDILFSFVGAGANEWYLTNVRNLILEHLVGEEDGYVRGRVGWHYQEVVYEHQILKQKKINELSSKASEEEEYVDVMMRSIFTLCPSGSGPNSIRLWEAIEAGSIPVILSDSWLPPGDVKLWESACIFVEESEEGVRGIPELLRSIAAQPGRLAKLRAGCLMIKSKYLDQTFVYDIDRRRLELEAPDWWARGENIKLQAREQGTLHALARASRLHHMKHKACTGSCALVRRALSRGNNKPDTYASDNPPLLKCWNSGKHF